MVEGSVSKMNDDKCSFIFRNLREIITSEAIVIFCKNSEKLSSRVNGKRQNSDEEIRNDV